MEGLQGSNLGHTHLSLSLPHTLERMQGVRAAVEGLQGSMQRVRGEVGELCARVRLLCCQAQNLHAAADLLRAVLLRLKLVARLRACLPPGTKSFLTPPLILGGARGELRPEHWICSCRLAD